MLVLGASSLAGGLIGAAIGFRAAISVVGPISIDPWNLVGAAIVLVWPLLVAGLSAVVGFAVGVILVTTIALGLRNDPATASTLAYLLALTVPVLPLTVWLMITIGNRWDAAAGPALAAGALLVGGILPGVAYVLATRSLQRRPQRGDAA